MLPLIELLSATQTSQKAQAELKWQADSAAEEYVIYRAEGDAAFAKIASTTGTAYTDTGVKAGKEYRYRIAAGGNSAVGAPGNILSLTLPGQPAIGAVLPLDNAAGYVLSWSAADGAEGYHVYRQSGSIWELIGTTGADCLTYTDKHTCTEAPTYRVAAFRDAIDSVPSASVTGKLIPAPTLKKAAQADGENSVQLTWSTCSGAANYRVYRTADGKSKAKLVAELNATETSWKDTSVQAGNGYSYQVTACYQSGEALIESSRSQAVSCTLLPLTTVSSAVQVKQKAQVKITWSKTDGAASYILYRAEGKKGAFERIAATTGTTYTDKSAEAGKTYRYRVACRAEADGGVIGAPSKAISVTLPGKSEITSVKPISGSKGFTIKWQKLTGVDGYIIYRAASSGSFKQIATVSKGKTTYTDTKVSAYADYRYRVAGYTKVSGKKIPSVLSDTAKATAVPKISLKSATAVKEKKTGVLSVELKWNTSSKADGYFVYRASGKSGSWKLVKTISGNGGGSWTDTKVSAGQTYRYSVVAWLKIGGKKIEGIRKGSKTVVMPE